MCFFFILFISGEFINLKHFYVTLSLAYVGRGLMNDGLDVLANVIYMKTVAEVVHIFQTWKKKLKRERYLIRHYH